MTMHLPSPNSTALPRAWHRIRGAKKATFPLHLCLHSTGKVLDLKLVKCIFFAKLYRHIIAKHY